MRRVVSWNTFTFSSSAFRASVSLLRLRLTFSPPRYSTRQFSPFLLLSSAQTFKFEEIQTLHFEVYDVDTSYDSADANQIDPAKQVCETHVYERTISTR